MGPYVQSERMGMFKQYAEQLVAEGKAYYCFCTEERLEALHAEQRAQGEMTHYDGCCRDLPQEEVQPAAWKRASPMLSARRSPAPVSPGLTTWSMAISR